MNCLKARLTAFTFFFHGFHAFLYPKPLSHPRSRKECHAPRSSHKIFKMNAAPCNVILLFLMFEEKPSGLEFPRINVSHLDAKGGRAVLNVADVGFIRHVSRSPTFLFGKVCPPTLPTRLLFEVAHPLEGGGEWVGPALFGGSFLG